MRAPRRRVEMPRERQKLAPCLTVQWTGVFEKTSRAWVKDNFWRVRNLLQDRDDALQECALTFAKCFDRYRYTVDNPKWFMSLYLRALANDWHTMATKDNRMREAAANAPLPEETTCNDGELLARLRQGSVELMAVLAMISDAPADLLQFVFGGVDLVTINRRLCRMAGIRYGTPDVVSELQSLLED